MTLSRQLIVLVATLVVVLFLGTFAISMYNTRDYLESQLASHAQDAATSLGLSATSQMQAEDKAIVTAMVNAMFHRGDYLSIRFETLDGETWIERAADLKVDAVPDWFVRAFVLHPPERSATMMSGWRQIGRVRVVSHPGLAYKQLWQTAQQTLNLFLIGALLVLLIGLVGLRLLLRPLKAVEEQAESICNREFPVVEGRPFTVEFRRVVEAMNRLSAKVSRMLSESEKVAGQLRQQAFQDPVTGLANRRQFTDLLEHRIAEPELFAGGALVLLQLRDFKAFNQAQGYQAGDQLLHDAGGLIEGAVNSFPGATVAHLAGADFAILLEGVGGDRLPALAGQIASGVATLYPQYQLPSADVAHVGAVAFAGQSSRQLLSEADMALREAQRSEANAWVVHEHGGNADSPRTGGAWRELIERAIEEQRFTLLKQPVIRCDNGELLHHEIFLRIQDPERASNEIAAAVFMPMAESAGLAPQVDRAVIERAIVALEAGAYPAKVAINLSPLSMLDRPFLDWLGNKLQAHPASAKKLILEFPEYGIVSHLEALTAFISRVSPIGTEFSLDHFGKGFSSFAYLRSVKAHYLKIDGSYIRHLDTQQDSRFFIKAISDIAHGLDMKVIAESVETEAHWQGLQAMGVDAGRGYFLGRPE